MIIKRKTQKQKKLNKKENSKYRTTTKNDGLGERFEDFFQKVITLCKKLPKNSLTNRQISQLIAAAGSVPSNYFEGKFGLSRRDSLKSFKISRKEARESGVWLRGLRTACNMFLDEFDLLIQESREIVFILSSVVEKIEKK